MCRLILIAFLVALALVGTGLFLLFYFLPWYYALPVLIVVAFLLPPLLKAGMKLLVHRFVGRFATGLLGTKSKVLHDATVQIHAITPAAAPARPAHQVEQLDSGAAAGVEVLTPNDYYLIDATIAPHPADTPMTHWEPGELMLIPFDADISPEQVFSDDDVEGWQAQEVHPVRDGNPAPDDAGKYAGPQRLQLLFSLPPSAPRRLKFRYYFESFGDLTLPPRH